MPKAMVFRERLAMVPVRWSHLSQILHGPPCLAY